MSKIAEKKALEEYPEVNPPYRTNIEAQVNVEHAYKREGYIKGYDQAMQDIEWFFYDKFNIHPHDCHVIQYVSDTPLETIDDFVEQFKNYIENEM